MNKLPGFVSANIRKSLDEWHVANYAQWRSQSDLEAMMQNPEARSHMAEATRLARVEPYLYQVVYSDPAE